MRAIATGHTGVTSAVLPNHLAISLVESLSAEGHHVGNGVDLKGHEFVPQDTADVAHFHGEFVIKLPLDGEVELMAHAGAEIRIDSRTGTSSDGIEARKSGLRQGIGGRWQRRGQAIEAIPRRADSEGRVWIRSTCAGAGAGSQRTDALNGLDEAVPQERDQH